MSTSSCNLTDLKNLLCCFLFCLFVFSDADFASGKSPFLKILTDAEAAANAAAIQLVSFKDAMEGELSVCYIFLCGVPELRLLDTAANCIHQTEV